MKKQIAKIIKAFLPKKLWLRKIYAALTRDRFAELDEKIGVATSVTQDKFANLEAKFDNISNYIDFAKPGFGFIWAYGAVGHTSWIEYMLTNNMPEKLAALRIGLDSESNATLDRFFKNMTILPKDWWYQYKVRREFVIDYRATPDELALMKTYEQNLEQYRKDYILDEPDRCADVFLGHTGLAYANNAVKAYIAGKDFIDAGAYIGDSALVYIKNYSPKKVWSFEISEKISARYLNVMRMNSIAENMYELVQAGLSDKKETIMFNDIGTMSTSLEISGESKVNLVDLDSFGKERNLNVGFIKSDVEGEGVAALRGMRETIRRDRPVLTLAIYHGPIEFFETRPLLEEIVKDLDYKIAIKKYHPYPDIDVDIALFAYPRELDKDDV